MYHARLLLVATLAAPAASILPSAEPINNFFPDYSMCRYLLDSTGNGITWLLGCKKKWVKQCCLCQKKPGFKGDEEEKEPPQPPPKGLLPKGDVSVDMGAAKGAMPAGGTPTPEMPKVTLAQATREGEPDKKDMKAPDTPDMETPDMEMPKKPEKPEKPEKLKKMERMMDGEETDKEIEEAKKKKEAMLKAYSPVTMLTERKCLSCNRIDNAEFGNCVRVTGCHSYCTFANVLLDSYSCFDLSVKSRMKQIKHELNTNPMHQKLLRHIFDGTYNESFALYQKHTRCWSLSGVARVIKADEKKRKKKVKDHKLLELSGVNFDMKNGLGDLGLPSVDQEMEKAEKQMEAEKKKAEEQKAKAEADAKKQKEEAEADAEKQKKEAKEQEKEAKKQQEEGEEQQKEAEKDQK